MKYLSNVAPQRRLLACVLSVGAAVAASTDSADAATVGFYGQEVLVSEIFDGVSANEQVTVGDDVELRNFGASDPDFPSGFLDFDIDIAAEWIELTSNFQFDAGPSLSFGFSFADADGGIDNILSALIGSGSSGFTGLTDEAISVVDGGNGILVDFQGVGIADGAVLRIDVEFGDPAIIPLPAGLPLALSGIAGLAMFGRRRRSA